MADFGSEVHFKVLTVMSPGGNITALKMVAASLAAFARGLNIYGFISSPRLVLPLSSATAPSRFLANEVYFRVTSYLKKKTRCDFSAYLSV